MSGGMGMGVCCDSVVVILLPRGGRPVIRTRRKTEQGMW